MATIGRWLSARLAAPVKARRRVDWEALRPEHCCRIGRSNGLKGEAGKASGSKTGFASTGRYFSAHSA
jgi:hypothetical protein